MNSPYHRYLYHRHLIEGRLKRDALATKPVRNSKHAAAICYKGQIITLGTCQKKTHPMMMKYQDRPERIYLHAEIDAIIKFINMYGTKPLKKCSLVVVRVNNEGELMPSKPCKGCQKAIKAFKIKEVIWS